jgi:hypothetical protein
LQLAGAIAFAPRAFAQPAKKVHRVGFVASTSSLAKFPGPTRSMRAPRTRSAWRFRSRCGGAPTR